MARKILLDQLTGQARSRHELRDKLAKKSVPDELAERLLDRFEEVGLVDDDAFARSWVRAVSAAAGLARRALAQELRRKGIDDEIARAALDEVDPDDEEAAARALVRKKLRSMRGVDRTTATRRLVGMLGPQGLLRRPGLRGGPRGAGRTRPGRLTRARGRTLAPCQRFDPVSGSSGGPMSTRVVVVHRVTGAGPAWSTTVESWGAAARRTCASMQRRAGCRWTSPGEVKEFVVDPDVTVDRPRDDAWRPRPT